MCYLAFLTVDVSSVRNLNLYACQMASLVCRIIDSEICGGARILDTDEVISAAGSLRRMRKFSE
jgi:hypothetical protein